MGFGVYRRISRLYTPKIFYPLFEWAVASLAHRLHTACTPLRRRFGAAFVHAPGAHPPWHCPPHRPGVPAFRRDVRDPYGRASVVHLQGCPQGCRGGGEHCARVFRGLCDRHAASPVLFILSLRLSFIIDMGMIIGRNIINGQPGISLFWRMINGCARKRRHIS
jgi:hypothetical protein